MMVTDIATFLTIVPTLHVLFTSEYFGGEISH